MESKPRQPIESGNLEQKTSAEKRRSELYEVVQKIRVDVGRAAPHTILRQNWDIYKKELLAVADLLPLTIAEILKYETLSRRDAGRILIYANFIRQKQGASANARPESPVVREEKAVAMAESAAKDSIVFGEVVDGAVLDAALPEEKSENIEKSLPAKKGGTIVPSATKSYIEKLLPEFDVLPKKVQWSISIIKKCIAEPGQINCDYHLGVVDKYKKRREFMSNARTDKQKIMSLLKSRLRNTDEGKDYEPSELAKRKIISWNEEEQCLVVSTGNEAKRKVSLGDVVADYEWGIRYTPDVSVPRELWRKIRKVSDFMEAKNEIQKIYNQELLYSHAISSMPTSALPLEFIENLDRGKESGFAGIIAERLAKTLLTRIQYNFPELGLEVESSNAFEDSVLKYDFKVKFSNYLRGVATYPEGSNRDEYIRAKQSVGIQFTVSRGASKEVSEKKKQVAYINEKLSSKKLQEEYNRYVKHLVDDVVLVAMPSSEYAVCFEKWLQNGKPSGGPEQYLPKIEKTRLLKLVSQGRLDLSDEEAERIAEGKRK